MKKVIHVLLYGLLLTVAITGMLGIRYFIIQEAGRTEQEAERQLAAQKAEADRLLEQEAARQAENSRMVLVKRLPIYKDRKIVKIKADEKTQMPVYGDTVTLLQEDSLYAQIRTENGQTGYVWKDCIGKLPAENAQPEGNVQSEGSAQSEGNARPEGNAQLEGNAQPEGNEQLGTGGSVHQSEKVVLIAVEDSAISVDQSQLSEEQGGEQPPSESTQPEVSGEMSEHTQADPEQDLLSRQVALRLEKRLEERGYTVIMAVGSKTDAVSGTKSAELASQILADAVIWLCADASAEPAVCGASVCCSASDGSSAAVRTYADSRKLGKYVLKYYTKATGFANAGIWESDADPALQRSKRPAVVLKLGDLMHEEESRRMKKPKFQEKMAKGIADGLDAYFRKLLR